MLAPKHQQAFNQEEGKREILRLGLRFCLPQNEVEKKTSCDTRKVEIGSAPTTWVNSEGQMDYLHLESGNLDQLPTRILG